MAAHYDDLAKKTFLVTGASSGVGRAIALALDKQGARIIITGRNKARLAEVASLISNNTTVLVADLSSEKERSALVEAMPELNGICHCAGVIHPFPVRFVDQTQFDRVFTINAVSPILLTSKLLGLKKLKEEASLVFLSSIASDRAMKGGSTYSASKAALESFSRTIALEHAAKRIRANCLRLGLIKTAIYDQAKKLANAAGAAESYESYSNRYPLGIGTPEDAASAALFLLSRSSCWITGSVLTVDGGLSTLI